MKIAITTPAGHIGRQTVAILQKQRGHELILLARDPGKVSEAQKRGAKAFQGDLWFGDYVKEATRGAEALLIVVPPNIWTDNVMEHYRRIVQNCADAARENGIARVVLASSIGAQHAEGTGPVKGLHAGEKILLDAVKNVAILRSAFYMENLMPQLPSIVETGKLYATLPPGVRFQWVATRDIAAEAAKTLTDAGWKGHRVIHIAAAREYSYSDAARILSDALGRHVQYERVSNDDAKKWFRSIGFSEHMAGELIEMTEALEKGMIAPEKKPAAQVKAPTTLEEFAKGTMAPAAEKMGAAAR
jgi:uncharacterized protein YbjT (DUF2867 family)